MASEREKEHTLTGMEGVPHYQLIGEHRPGAGQSVSATIPECADIPDQDSSYNVWEWHATTHAAPSPSAPVHYYAHEAVQNSILSVLT